jgi:Tol biopolymer transport system component
MGVVFRAMDLELHREVALKCPWPDHVKDPVLQKRFLREGRASSKLSHPNIVPILDSFETNGLPWIAFQLVEGRDLQCTLAQVGRLPAVAVVRHSEEIAQALAAAHAKGILHRDITPRNILLSKDGHALLTDFGLARTLRNVDSETSSSSDATLTEWGSILGTPRYMSPEQTLGTEVDERSDLFSFGAVIYQMCTGHHAFPGEKFGEVLDAIMHREPEPISRFTYEVPAELERIVRKLLAKNLEERYQSARDLLADLRALRRELESGSWKQPKPHAAWWKHPAAIAGIAGAAVLITFILLQRREPAWSTFPLGNPIQVTTGAGLDTDPAISPDGTRIAYSSDEGGQLDIYVIDVRGGTPLRLTDHSSADTAPTWFPDGSAIAFVSNRSGELAIWKVGQMGGSSTLLVPNAYDPAFSPDGKWIAFTRGDSTGFDSITVAPVNQTSAARVLTGPLVSSGAVGSPPHCDAAWSNDGREIAFSAWDNLWIVPHVGGEPRQLTSQGMRDREPAYSPDGRTIYFASYRQGIPALWRVDRRTGVSERLTTGAGQESRPSVSRDGARLVYCTHSSSQDENDVVLLDRTSGEEIVFPGGSDDMLPALSPDESFFVFVSNRQGSKYDLWKQRLERRRPVGPPERITDQPGNASHPAISPDARWIVYYLIEGEVRNLWMTSVDPGLPIRITDQSTPTITPSWSPDGTRIAFLSRGEDGVQLWVATVRNGHMEGQPKRLRVDKLIPRRPAWSPSGDRIAVIREIGKDMEVWILPADGGEECRPFTHGAQALEVRSTKDAFAVWGMWARGRVECRFVDAKLGSVLEHEPAIDFGDSSSVYNFDISPTGNLIAFARDRTYGDLWVLEAKGGSY